jgi:hypothetical protein
MPRKSEQPKAAKFPPVTEPEQTGLSRRHMLFGLLAASAFALPLLSPPAKGAVTMLRTGLDPELFDPESDVITVGRGRGGGGRGGGGRGRGGGGRGRGGGGRGRGGGGRSRHGGGGRGRSRGRSVHVHVHRGRGPRRRYYGRGSRWYGPSWGWRCADPWYRRRFWYRCAGVWF